MTKLTRRALFGIFSTSPIIAAIPPTPTTIQPNNESFPSSGWTGLWVHVEEGHQTSQEYFRRITDLIKIMNTTRLREGRYPKVYEYVPFYKTSSQFIGPSRMDAKMRNEMEILRFNTTDDLLSIPLIYLHMADVVTIKPIDGPVKFWKCRWEEREVAESLLKGVTIMHRMQMNASIL